MSENAESRTGTRTAGGKPPLRILFAAAVSVLFATFLTLTWVTQDAMRNSTKVHLRGTQQDLGSRLVDLRPWRAAQQLFPLAVTAEEAEYARDALHLAAHDVDQAFDAALRAAALQSRPNDPRLKALTQEIDQLTRTLSSDKAQAEAVAHAGPTSTANKTAESADDLGATELDLANAQVQLDQDELNEAKGDLARLSNDPRPRIQQEWTAYQAALQKAETQSGNGTPAAGTPQAYGTLAGRIRAWQNQNARYALIQSAMHSAQADTKALTDTHNKLEKQFGASAATGSDSGRSTRLHALQTRSAERQLLALYDSRIQNETRLAEIFQKWGDQVAVQRAVVIHLIWQSCAWIAFVLLCVLALQEVIRRLAAKPSLDRRRRQTFQTVLRLGVQLSGAIAILFILFGAPTQTPTIVGLTTAGLTLVLQDFIIAFFGWFILMGRNGVRIGDWVEINGVAGEVVDIGLFRTTLLETGNWTAQGHPTGRRVTFINSFAIKGQFFNFSTSGQWMWDEITVSSPATVEPYDFLEQVRALVQNETAADTEQAALDWQRTSHRGGQSISLVGVAPTVDMRPSGTGVDVVVRYITKASSRLATKSSLYSQMCSLLRHPTSAQ